MRRPTGNSTRNDAGFQVAAGKATAGEPGGIGELDPFALQRIASRECVTYLLDVIGIARGERHLLDTLLLAAIIQANVAPISRQADLQITYATLDDPPPDSLRRPVSINALAQSLRLPFETVRRRVKGLVRGGFCESGPAGVVVPGRVLTAPKYLTDAFIGYERLRAFYYRMSDFGLLGELPPATIVLGSRMAPVRAVARLASDYVLRVIDDASTEFGDPLHCIILLEILRSNTEHLTPVSEPPGALTAEGFVTDEMRRPVRVSQLAKRLGLAAETVRRHVAELAAKGWSQSTAGRGLIIPSEMLARPAVARFMTGNMAHLQRMFSGLSQLGVLEIWDSVREPPAA